MEIFLKANLFDTNCGCDNDYCYCDCDDCGCDYDNECSGDGTPCTQD